MKSNEGCCDELDMYLSCGEMNVHRTVAESLLEVQERVTKLSLWR